jgi:hypothetical protein
VEEGSGTERWRPAGWLRCVSLPARQYRESCWKGSGGAPAVWLSGECGDYAGLAARRSQASRRGRQRSVTSASPRLRDEQLKMNTIVWLAAILFVVVGVIFILRRNDLARAQSLVAGGRLGAGCAIAEGIVFLLMAIATVVLHRYGWFD